MGVFRLRTIPFNNNGKKKLNEKRKDGYTPAPIQMHNLIYFNDPVKKKLGFSMLVN